jgi:very-short-patch-repair endonuclease
MTYRLRPTKHASPTQRIADNRRRGGTNAERELERILNEVNGGALRGRFQREWAYGGRWIVDFFFRELRLGIEVEGGYHRSLKQQLRDIDRELTLEQLGVTLVRIANEDVFGDRNALLNKLRDSWRRAQIAHREFSERSKSVQRRRLAAPPAKIRRKQSPSVAYSGGWTSIKQGHNGW